MKTELEELVVYLKQRLVQPHLPPGVALRDRIKLEQWIKALENIRLGEAEQMAIAYSLSDADFETVVTREDCKCVSGTDVLGGCCSACGGVGEFIKLREDVALHVVIERRV